jgi:Trp operon repressor
MNSTQLIKKCSSEKEITQLLELLLTDKEYQALQEENKNHSRTFRRKNAKRNSSND